MINGKSVLALIPARAGSKGLPEKNIKNLNGKPLIEWSISSAKQSEYIDEVVVSTDSIKIAQIAKEAGALVPFLRPAELSTDIATSVDVAIHALTEFQVSGGKHFDLIVLLEPTSPIRLENQLDTMIQKLSNQNKIYDGIVSLGPVREHPEYMKKIIGGNFIPLMSDKPFESRRQETEEIFSPYGTAFVIKTEVLMREKTFYPERATYEIIEPEQCFEIDTITDFLIVEFLMSLIEKRKEQVTRNQDKSNNVLSQGNH